MDKNKKEERVFNPAKDLIRCNLCQKEMLFAKYESHYDKCLAITTLIPLMKQNGQKVEYKDLDEYEISSLDKLLEQYIPGINKPKSSYKKEENII